MAVFFLCCTEAFLCYGWKVVSWRIADAIDFELLLAEGDDIDDAALRARDREIFQMIAQRAPWRPISDRRDIFRAWLEARRSQLPQAAPGGYFLSSWQLLSVFSGLAGAAIGMSVSAAVLLAYRGEEPVNVAWFFACTVGIQWLIMAAALLIWLIRRTL